MPLSVKHSKLSDKSDGQDPSLLQPSDWNADHEFKVEAKSLVGNSTNSEANAESVHLSDDFKLEDGELSLTSNLSDIDIVVATVDDDNPDNARVLTTTPTVAWDVATAKQAKANVVDKGITLAKMELGEAGGEVLYYDKTTKAPVRLPYGTKGMVLQTGTAAVTGPPAVAAVNPAWGFSGFPHVVLQGQKTGTEGSFAAGSWITRLLATAVYDLYDLVLTQTQGTPAVGTNRFRLVAGTYVAEWNAPALLVGTHQTRLYNITDSVAIGYGTTELAYDDPNNDASQSRSVGIVKFTIAANKDLALQHRASSANTTNGFGIASPFATGSPDIFSVVKIWRIA